MTAIPFHPEVAILIIPLVAAGLLAVLPGYRLTARLNVLASLLTFLAALSLFVAAAAGAGRLFPDRRPQHRLHRAVELRRLHHLDLQRELYRPRARDRAADADLSPLLPRHVPGADVRHEPRADGELDRRDVGGDRDRDADHRADGRHLPHPRGAGGGVEILHPRQRRHRARPVRHHPRLHGGAAGGRRGHRRDALDRARRPRRRVRPGLPQRRLRLPLPRLRHQGRPRAAPRLAARRPCRGPDADLGGALRPPPQRRALRRAPLQDPARRQSRGARAGAADDDDGARLAGLRRLHALPAARHQTHVRLLLDRAHGDHRLRLRPRRSARQFRRALPHGDALAHQVRDLLRRRPHRAGQGHAGDRPRSPGSPSAIRCSAGRWCSASSPSPACRRSASS